MNIYRYPKSKLLGNLPCGKTPTPNNWLNLGAPYNTPVYPNAPNENCGEGKCEVTGSRFKDADNELVLTREILKKGNNRALQLENSNLVTPMSQKKYMITPFRALMNAGDTRGANNKYIADKQLANIEQQSGMDQIYVKAINQVSSTRRASNQSSVRLSGYLPKTNVSGNSPDGGSASATWTGNSKYVYDGSDYIKFKKLQANNRNYNDRTYGGDRNNASQVARARVRH